MPMWHEVKFSRVLVSNLHICCSLSPLWCLEFSFCVIEYSIGIFFVLMPAHFLEEEKIFVVYIYIVFFQRPILNIFVLDPEKCWFPLVSSQIFFFCMLCSFIFWFCFWCCFKYSFHHWCGHDWMNIICQVLLYSDMALSIFVIACMTWLKKFANPFKPRLLTHDFLQKSQIHERIWDVNWRIFILIDFLFRSFIHSCFFFYILILLWILLSSLVWTWLKKNCQPWQASSADTRFAAKTSNPCRVYWIRKAWCVWGVIWKFFYCIWFSIQNFYFIHVFLDSLEKKHRPWPAQAKRKIALMGVV